MKAKQYLGDGVYAEINEHDQLVLTTEDGVHVTNTIYLSPEVVEALFDYVSEIYEQ